MREALGSIPSNKMTNKMSLLFLYEFISFCNVEKGNEIADTFKV